VNTDPPPKLESGRQPEYHPDSPPKHSPAYPSRRVIGGAPTGRHQALTILHGRRAGYQSAFVRTPATGIRSPAETAPGTAGGTNRKAQVPLGAGPRVRPGLRHRPSVRGLLAKKRAEDREYGRPLDGCHAPREEAHALDLFGLRREVPITAHRGMFPCFFGGRFARFVRSARSAFTTETRVAAGSMTPSSSPRSAARNGDATL
jgi:hypothetical protein